MHYVGFSTGTLAKSGFRRAISMLQPFALKVIELSALREAELLPMLEALDELDLSGYSHVSFHAPSQLSEFTEEELCTLLLRVAERGWYVVVHPDIVNRFEPWRMLGPHLCIENMDKRKPIGRTAAELDLIFTQLPEAKLCLDLGHAKQIDPSLLEVRNILENHNHRLRQIHLSDVNSESGHERLNHLAVMSFQSIAHLIPESVPVILEGPVEETEIAAELELAQSVWKVPASA